MGTQEVFSSRTQTHYSVRSVLERSVSLDAAERLLRNAGNRVQKLALDANLRRVGQRHAAIKVRKTYGGKLFSVGAQEFAKPLEAFDNIPPDHGWLDGMATPREHLESMRDDHEKVPAGGLRAPQGMNHLIGGAGAKLRRPEVPNEVLEVRDRDLSDAVVVSKVTHESRLGQVALVINVKAVKARVISDTAAIKSKKGVGIGGESGGPKCQGTRRACPLEPQRCIADNRHLLRERVPAE